MNIKESENHQSNFKLMRKRDIARLLDVSPRSIDNLLLRGMPHIRFGPKMLRFDPVQVFAWAREKFGARRFGPVRARVATDEALDEDDAANPHTEEVGNDL